MNSVGCSEGWQSPPAQGHGELSTTAWAETTEKRAISCLMRGLADEEGTEPLGTLTGSVVAERDAALAEMWSTGLCTSQAHLDFTASLQNGATASPSLPSLAGARQGCGTPGQPVPCQRRAGAGEMWHLPAPTLSQPGFQAGVLKRLLCCDSNDERPENGTNKDELYFRIENP